MIIGLLFLYYGVPIILALVLMMILHVPFRRFKNEPDRFRIFLRFRISMVFLGPIAMLVFKLAGGYDNVLSSGFSPIGTDEWGVIVYVISHTIVAFTIISLIDLIHIVGNCDETSPENNRSESDRSRD